MAMPDYYFPLFRNSFLSTAPWKRQFDIIFGSPDRIVDTPIKFYFTKANVVSGKLDFTTNNPGSNRGIPDRRINHLMPGESKKEESFIARDRYTFCNKENRGEFLRELKDGIFASMTFPPVVPQSKKGTAIYEDGGVIDNLPIYFGSAIEDCQFLFILPLNADFETEKINRGSIILRLFRVLGMRQGALEQHALKQIRLHNRLANARWLGWELKEKRGDLRKELQPPYSPEYAENSYQNNPIKVFAVCPDNLIVDTLQFWKTENIKKAFDIMYESTARLLDEGDPLNNEGKFSKMVERIDKVILYKVNGLHDIEVMDLEATPI